MALQAQCGFQRSFSPPGLPRWPDLTSLCHFPSASLPPRELRTIWLLFLFTQLLRPEPANVTPSQDGLFSKSIFFPLRNSHQVIFLLLTSFWGQYDPSLSLLLVNIRGWNKAQLFTFHFLNLVTLFIVSFVRSWTSILYLVFRKYSQSLLCLDVVYPLYGAAQAYWEDYSKKFWRRKTVIR